MTPAQHLVLIAHLRAQIAAQDIQIELLSTENFGIRLLYEELLHLCIELGVSEETLDKFRQALRR